jgi:hypothetical protein
MLREATDELTRDDLAGTLRLGIVKLCIHLNCLAALTIASPDTRLLMAMIQ